MGSWSEQFENKVKAQLKNKKASDLRFFRIDEFIRNMGRVDEFSDSCPLCNKEKLNIADTVEHINEAIGTPGNRRCEYDRLSSRLSAHMRKEHGFYPPYYFSYLYSFYGFVAGLIIGYLMYLIVPSVGELMFFVGFCLFLIAGYVAGTRKDNRIRMNKKLM